MEFKWRDETALRSELESCSGLRIHLTVTDNTRSMLSVRREVYRHSVKVRLHHMFLCADLKVIHALANWLKTDRATPPAPLVNDFIHEHVNQIRLQPEKPGFVTIGNVFNLTAIFNELNAQHFGKSVTASVTWGRMPPARRRRSIRFGSYTPCDNVIRIHPLLDQPFIPMFFMRYIMFHEMLHAFLGIEEMADGRRRYHTKEFLATERAFPDYHRAVEWQNSRINLNRLLTCR